ncbi:UvrB/UvrC motif-containing protein [Candidatus Chlamydia corallus]|uniref:UvrB/UvrC motif-containing protein n=1 Tax=Candidatus Chlamydia corallus TaxID=2038470 RepID=UPI000C2FA461|nr:UvrB/UvrC motif-containing protein [Candidatus Chlamydia corallus]
MTNSPTHQCYHCQKPATICYTKIDKDRVIRSYVCATCSCPSYYYNNEHFGLSKGGGVLTLECGNCKTVWHSQQDDEQLLGCHQCYTNFKNQITTKLKNDRAVSSSFIMEKGQGSLHIGRAPGETSTSNPLLKLIALNEALKDTLEREDYEQAAVIRDQINHLKTKNPHDSSQ